MRRQPKLPTRVRSYFQHDGPLRCLSQGSKRRIDSVASGAVDDSVRTGSEIFPFRLTRTRAKLQTAANPGCDGGCLAAMIAPYASRPLLDAACACPSACGG